MGYEKKAGKFWTLFIISVLLIMIIFLTVYKEKLTIIYIVNTYIPAKQLPNKWVMPALEFVTGFEFPVKTTNVQGIFQGGRDPLIFASFDADPNQIEQIMFQNSHNAKVKTVDAEYFNLLKSYDTTLFPMADIWQKELNVQLFDPNCIRQGTFIENGIERGFKILIDIEAHKAYIYAWY
jgi:hypothetical protein